MPSSIQISIPILSEDRLNKAEFKEFRDFDVKQLLARKGGLHYRYMSLFLSSVEAVCRFIPKGAKIADIGCAQGNYTIHLGNHGYYVTGVDMRRAPLAYARLKLVSGQEDKVSFVQADTELLPFSDSTFDAALFLETLHHLMEPEKAISEVRRILKPNGILILSTHNGECISITRHKGMDLDTFMQEQAQGTLSYSYKFDEPIFELTKEQVASFLSSHGFAILHISMAGLLAMFPFWGIIPFSFVEKLGLDKALLKIPPISRKLGLVIIAVARKIDHD